MKKIRETEESTEVSQKSEERIQLNDYKSAIQKEDLKLRTKLTKRGGFQK